jgi:GT2 family glycosyltransferase
MFDPKFYRFQNPDIDTLDDAALECHFNEVGWKAGLDPSAFFNTHVYLAQNSDVLDAEVNPFLHYLNVGKAEGRRAMLSHWGRKTSEVFDKGYLDFCRPWVDIAALRVAHPELAELDNDSCAAWYLVVGWQYRTDPSEKFSVSYYLDVNDDVATAELNPLLHYLQFGQVEGRFATQEEEWTAQPSEELTTPEPEFVSEPELPEKPLVGQNQDQLRAEMESVRSFFDFTFYRSTYDDVDGDDDALLYHYMSVGWTQGRNPSPTFESSYYLDQYVDIAESGSNPFLHYVLFGRKEGRRCAPAGPVRLALAEDAPLTEDLPDILVATPSQKTPRPPHTVNADCLDIHWVVPDFRSGSGGHMTIFRMVRYLELFGHRNTIWIEKPVFHETEHEAWETIVKSFQCVEAKVRFVSDDLFETSGDVTIATGWSTAWTVNALKGFKARMYFVQDHEPEFYPTGSQSNLAKLTYGFDLGCICASPWLEQLMTDHYERWARAFYLAYEPEQYFVKDLPRPAVTHTNMSTKVAVYGRAHTDRRCVQLALAGLKILSKSRDNFEVHFFGQDDMAFATAPFIAYNHGVLSPEKLNDLYNICDVGICFSGTNYSLVPQEMMASGLPLIEFDTESTQVIFPEDTVTLAGPQPSDIAAKLGTLMDDPDRLARQRQAALDWVNQFSWRDSARTVETTIKDYLAEKGAKLTAPAITKTKDILFDVIVPTWNGKEEFEPVLNALRTQKMADQMQIHCVDSSSTDGTIDWLKDQKDVSLTVIDQKEFQHGRTRNFGASLGTAPYIGFITQDAMPATHHWATDIVKMFNAVPDAAGLFGRHIAYPDHAFFVQQEITNHFNNMLKHPLVLSKHTDPERWESGDIGWRQFLHFYSDNNSAMRRSIWSEIPYAEVDYGEDQVWARDIIDAGYSKIYAPTATVYHSHDYNPAQTYKRSKTEGAFFYEHFGYMLGNGTDDQIVQQIAREQRNMETWGRSHGINSDEIEMRKDNIAEKYHGWRDGRAEVQA